MFKNPKIRIFNEFQNRKSRTLDTSDDCDGNQLKKTIVAVLYMYTRPDPVDLANYVIMRAHNFPHNCQSSVLVQYNTLFSKTFSDFALIFGDISHSDCLSACILMTYSCGKDFEKHEITTYRQICLSCSTKKSHSNTICKTDYSANIRMKRNCAHI